jgi:class 3 adenylate cyclase
MTTTTEAVARTIADRYLAVWSMPDPEARRDAIASLWEPDGVEYVEGIQFRGHDELDARIAHAYDQFVGSGTYSVTTPDDVTAHGDVITGTVQLSDADGEVAWAARVFIVVGETGRIKEDYQLTVKPLPA